MAQLPQPCICTRPRCPAFSTLRQDDEEEEEEEAEEEGGGAGVRTGGMDVDAGEEARDDGIPVQVRLLLGEKGWTCCRCRAAAGVQHRTGLLLVPLLLA